MKKLITIFTLLALLVSCDNAKGIVLDKPVGDLSEAQLNMIKNDLTAEEKQSLMRYEVRRTFGQTFSGTKWETLTVGEAIENQEELEARHKEKKEEELEQHQAQSAALSQAEGERQAKLTELRKTYKFALLSKKLVEKDYQKYNYMCVRIQNHGKVGIRAIAYNMVLDDLFGDNIATLGFKCSSAIPANKQFDAEYNVPYNPYMDKDKAIANATISNMRITFEPTKIILEDGSTIEL